MAYPTLSGIVSDYRRNKLPSEIEGDWGSVVAYRPPSFVIAWLLLRTPVTPTMVTVAGMLLLPIMIAVAVFAEPQRAVAIVCVLAMLFCTLDCVDGTLARARGTSSLLGYYLDLAADIVYRVVAYGCLGHLADRIAPASNWLALALAAAWLTLFVRVTGALSRQAGSSEDKREEDKAPPQPFATLPAAIYSALSGLDTLLPFLALACWWAGLLPALIVWLFVYGAADAIYNQIAIVRGLWGK